jgi:predicted ATP-grasp superfamily ATP-dependent carboligase
MVFMRLGAFEVNEPVPELKKPHALAVLRPWIDVGNVGSLTLSRLESSLGGHELATLHSPGDFYDFTRYRPTIYLREDRRELQVPNTVITYGNREEGHDFIFLHLLEPHMSAEEYMDSVLQIFRTLNVERYCLLGAMYDMVPHTRPLLVSGTASNLRLQNEMAAMRVMPSEYQGPTTILFALYEQAIKMGIETLSLIVHLPQYMIMEEDFRGLVRVMEVLGTLYGFPLAHEDADRAKKQEDQVSQIADRMVQMEPRYQQIRSQLEAYYDARVGKKGEEVSLSPEIERFLQDLGKRFGQN